MKGAKDELAAHYAAFAKLKNDGVNPVLCFDVLYSHLRAVPANSFFTWNLPYPVLWPIVRGELAVVCFFDLAGFFFAAERAGLIPSLSTRKEAEQVFSAQGRSGAPGFGGRIVKVRHPSHTDERMLLSGAFSRFINNLHSPLSFLIGMKNHWAEISAPEQAAT